MKNRILDNLEHMDEKEEMYSKIKRDYISLTIHERCYLGNLEKIDEEKNYLFIGMDEELLSFKGFLNFKQYEEDQELIFESNHYHILSDGICICEISNLAPFADQIKSFRIPHYQEKNTISDIDEMNGISYEKYITYVFRKIGYEVSSVSMSPDQGYDLIVTDGKVKSAVQLKLFKNPKSRKHFGNGMKDYLRVRHNDQFDKHILITNADFGYLPNILDEQFYTVIDRVILSEITKNPEVLLNFLKQ